MLLTIDVGNTDITLGAWKGTKLTHLWRADSQNRRTADEYAALFTEMFRMGGYTFADVEDVAIGSVVPPVTRMLRWMTEKYTGRPALVVSAESDHGLPLEVDEPREVGADRILNAVAALAHWKPPLVVVDFGTATTFDYVKKNGAYGGGPIVPGIQTSLGALVARAAQLSAVEVKEPPRVIGTNTVHAMQSGVYFGELARVDGLIERMEAESGAKLVAVIATGGLAPLIASGSRRIQEVREELTLDGLRIVRERLRAERPAAGLMSRLSRPKK
jgi:type III pantothenate kinase